MNCPYCNKELEVMNIEGINWVNENDTVVEMECFSHCFSCGRDFTFIKKYTKIEEKNLEEF